MALALVWASLAVSFVIGLAAVVRMAGPVPRVDDVSGVVRLPEQVTVTIVTLFALAALVFLTDLARRWLSGRTAGDAEAERAVEPSRVPPWLRTVTQILAILNSAVLAYLLWRGVIPFSGLLSLGRGAGSAPSVPLTLPESAPPVITWTFGILALAAGLGALALAVRVALVDRLGRGREDSAGEAPAAPLQAAVEEGLEDLRSEPDARRAIVRCYARFERAAADSGVDRKPWFTPMEFMREALNRLPIPRTAVPTLTGLFELARFSHHALGPRERDRALEALDQIRAAMEARDGDAGAR